MNYSWVDLPKLNTIIEEVRQALPIESPTNRLWYPKLKLPILRSALKELGHKKYLFAVNMLLPHAKTPIHADLGPHKWSLNIPVWNTENTSIRFFETSATPVRRPYPGNVFYLGYPDDCKEIERLEVNSPILLNTKAPYQVTSESDKTRVMLLVRLED